jgi:nucleotide-binding universal stress UspA family protein
MSLTPFRQRRSLQMYSKILIANDGSAGAARALDAAIELARRLRSSLDMVCVEELPRFPTSVDEVVEEEAEAKKMFDEIILTSRKQAKAAHVKLEAHVIPGHAVSSIVEFVQREKFDLLVVGFMGHSALYNRLIGSTTDRLVELAPCKVLVVK